MSFVGIRLPPPGLLSKHRRFLLLLGILRYWWSFVIFVFFLLNILTVHFSNCSRNLGVHIVIHWGLICFFTINDKVIKGMVSIDITATPSEAALAYAILQFCINVYRVYFNVPLSKVIRRNSIKVKQRQQCRSTSDNLMKFMVPDFFCLCFWA